MSLRQFTSLRPLTRALTSVKNGMVHRWTESARAPGLQEDLYGITLHLPLPSDVRLDIAANPMDQRIVVRCETEADVGVISDVTVEAFKTLAISNHTEQYIVAALRAAKCLALWLVAEVDGRVVGHVAFSPVTTSSSTRGWFGLGPLSVLPEYQRQGIGKALMEEGLARLTGLNGRGCCLVGHPDYYRKFGFKNVRGLTLAGGPSEVFLALSLDDQLPQGTVTFHEAFKADGQQTGAGDAGPRAWRSWVWSWTSSRGPSLLRWSSGRSEWSPSRGALRSESRGGGLVAMRADR